MVRMVEIKVRDGIKKGMGSLTSTWLDIVKSMKGGKENMEIKSRYEVIAELERQKREFIQERDGFDDRLKTMRNNIRDSEREIEDEKEEHVEFKKTIEARKETIKELITSVDESLKRLSNLKK